MNKHCIYRMKSKRNREFIGKKTFRQQKKTNHTISQRKGRTHWKAGCWRQIILAEKRSEEDPMKEGNPYCRTADHIQYSIDGHVCWYSKCRLPFIVCQQGKQTSVFRIYIYIYIYIIYIYYIYTYIRIYIRIYINIYIYIYIETAAYVWSRNN